MLREEGDFAKHGGSRKAYVLVVGPRNGAAIDATREYPLAIMLPHPLDADPGLLAIRHMAMHLAVGKLAERDHLVVQHAMMSVAYHDVVVVMPGIPHLKALLV